MFTKYIIIVIEQDPVVVVIRFKTDGEDLGGIAKNGNAHLRLPRGIVHETINGHNDDIM